VLLRRQQELCSPPENYVYAGAPRLSATHTELSYKNEHNPTPSGTLRTHPSPCGSRCATITNVVSGNSARSSDMTSFSVSRARWWLRREMPNPVWPVSAVPAPVAVARRPRDRRRLHDCSRKAKTRIAAIAPASWRPNFAAGNTSGTLFYSGELPTSRVPVHE
jgi:hypothetical protein